MHHTLQAVARGTPTETCSPPLCKIFCSYVLKKSPFPSLAPPSKQPNLTYPFIDGRPQTSVFPDSSFPLTPTLIVQQTLGAPATQSIQNLNSSPLPLPHPQTPGPHSQLLPGLLLRFRPSQSASNTQSPESGPEPLGSEPSCGSTSLQLKAKPPSGCPRDHSDFSAV